MRVGMVVLAVLVALLVWKVGGNLMSKGNPPPACQVWGGQWGLWSGWQCG